MAIESSALIGIIEDAHDRVARRQLTHEHQASKLVAIRLFLRKAQIALTVSTTGSALAVIFGESHIAAIFTAVLGGMALMVELTELRFSYDERISLHLDVAHRLWSIRERYRNLRADISDGHCEPADAIKQRDMLASQVEEVYRNEPSCSDPAYQRTKAAVESGELTLLSKQ